MPETARPPLRLAQLSPRPDLIPLDIMMPDMDGHMVLAELRKNPLTRDIPVIFVTAMNDPEEEERGISEGAADFVTKPVKPAMLGPPDRSAPRSNVARGKGQVGNTRLETACN